MSLDLTATASPLGYPPGMARVVIAEEDYGVLYLPPIPGDQPGWASGVATNGAELWEKVQRQAPDAVAA